MAILKTLYNKIRDDYVRRLTQLDNGNFLRVIPEIVFFAPVKLEITHVQQIFQKTRQEHRNHWFSGSGGPEKFSQLWENILSTGEDSLLNPKVSRVSIVKRWLPLHWDMDTLLVIAGRTRAGEFEPAWKDRVWMQKKFSPPILNEIAYGQLYHLAGSREEKTDILRSAWEFHFNLSLISMDSTEKVYPAERMLEEHIRQFPEDIPGLRKTFYDMIMHYCDGKRRRGGWAGIAVIGAGEYETELLECLKVRVENLSFGTGKAGMHSGTGSYILYDPADEIEGITRWVPESEGNRQVMRRVLENLLHSPCPSQIRKDVWSGYIQPAIWKARMKLESSEERLLESISCHVSQIFEKSMENDYTALPSLATVKVLTDWQPRAPEIREKLWQLWAENVKSGASARIRDNYFVRNQFWKFWKGLIALDPEHPELGTLLLASLSRASDEMFWDTVIPWLQKHGVPPGTPMDVRRQLEEKILEPPDIPQHFPSREKLCEQVSEAAFYVLLSSPPDMDEKRQAWREEQIQALLDNIRILARVTECMESQISPQSGRGLELVRAKWEEKLAALGHQTPSGEKRAILEYFARRTRCDQGYCPTDTLREKVLFLIREERCEDIVILAARLGHCLAIRGDQGFFRTWAQTVQEREMGEYNGKYHLKGDLSTHLNLIRQEAVIQVLSSYLDSENGRPAPSTSASAGADKVADWELLRELFHLFPETVENEKRRWDAPARVWPEETVDIIRTGGGRRKKSEEAPETPDTLRVLAGVGSLNSRRTLVFGTVPGGDGGQLPESHRQMVMEPSISDSGRDGEQNRMGPILRPGAGVVK